MENFAQIIRDHKPNIKDSTIKSYLSNLRGLMKKLECDKIDPRCFSERKKDVIDILRQAPPKTRKTKLASIVVLLESVKAPASLVDIYRSLMLEEIEAVSKEDDKQELSEVQKRVMKPWEHFKAIAASLLKKHKGLLTQSSLTDSEKESLVNLALALIFTEIPPRRLLDYQQFKLRDYDPKIDNFWDKKKKEFVFNDYKTAKTYGQQRVAIPTSLNSFLTKYQKLFGEYLIGEDGMSKTRLNRQLQKVFGANVSVNILRHSFISSVVLKDVPRLTYLQEVAKDMGNSVDTQLRYKKFDDQSE